MINETDWSLDFPKNAFVELAVNAGAQTFFYKGYILKDSGLFLEFKDVKKGKMKISKAHVFSATLLGGDSR